jgi:hypothetical protein
VSHNDILSEQSLAKCTGNTSITLIKQGNGRVRTGIASSVFKSLMNVCASSSVVCRSVPLEAYQLTAVSSKEL